MKALVVIILSLPLLAAAVLALFALARRLLRALPAHEYEQAVRAPLWLVVTVGLGLAVLAAAGLAGLGDGGSEPYYNIGGQTQLFIADAYAYWCVMLLGLVLAVAAWVPAARRSLGEHGFLTGTLLLLLTWCAVLLPFSVNFTVTLAAWAGLLLGTALLWLLLATPSWSSRAFLEPLIIFAAALLLGWPGLLWLRALGQDVLFTRLWSELITALPRAVQGSMLLVALAWLGPAAYLPWWAWPRRGERALAWLPAALLLAVAGPLALVRLFFFGFPAVGTALWQSLGLEYLFLVRDLLAWMLNWALIALLAGVGLMVYTLLRPAPDRDGLRPLAFTATGVLLLGLVAGLYTQTVLGVAALLWALLAWAGTMTVLLAGGHLLDAQPPTARAERDALAGCLWIALAILCGVPPGPGYWALADGWSGLRHLSAPWPLIILALAATAVCGALQLPRWLRRRQPAEAFPGAAWGILGPFLLTLVLLAAGLLAVRLLPLADQVHRALTQAY